MPLLLSYLYCTQNIYTQLPESVQSKIPEGAIAEHTARASSELIGLSAAFANKSSDSPRGYGDAPAAGALAVGAAVPPEAAVETQEQKAVAVADAASAAQNLHNAEGTVSNLIGGSYASGVFAGHVNEVCVPA
jgi:hypothetical protein